MSLLLNLMKNLPDCHQIYISYDPENNGARSLYTVSVLPSPLRF
jgi:hypothetical protein